MPSFPASIRNGRSHRNACGRTSTSQQCHVDQRTKSRAQLTAGALAVVACTPAWVADDAADEVASAAAAAADEDAGGASPVQP